jgi:glycolate oxidase iron-sulfur subunit
VAVLLGCIQDQLFRRVNEATVRVLEANGWEVVAVPGQGCCGALHAHAGRLSEAREMALGNVAAFRASGVDLIVANAAGCGAAMKDYAHLMEGEAGQHDSDDVHWFSERVRDVSEILASGGKPPLGGAPLPIRVAYDPPCHLLHGQRVAEPPKTLLRAIPGLELVSVPKGEECCGGAGVYGITHPDLGQQIGGDKVSAVLETGASVVATGNPGCAMQIGAGLRLRGSDVGVAHPVELLDESYRRGGLYTKR